MSLNEIQQAIEALPAEQQARLVAWLSERDRRQWDLDLAQDFSPGGAGMPVLDRVRTQVASGESKPMSRDRQRR
jgi:hypothetical protein